MENEGYEKIIERMVRLEKSIDDESQKLDLLEVRIKKLYQKLIEAEK
jgi:hypothetical protein